MPKEIRVPRLQNSHSPEPPRIENYPSAKTPSQIFSFARNLMELLNNREVGLEAYGQILDKLMDFLEIGACAIRLRLGDDFPFFVSRGFSDRFIEEDNFICCRDLDGNVARHENGKPRFSCFCGEVISRDAGRLTAPLTPSGILIANGESELDPAGRDLCVNAPKIKCVLEGFSAICLTPIKSSEGVAGLLIMADSRPITLTDELNALLEILSFGMGAAFERLLPPSHSSTYDFPEKEKLVETLFGFGPVGVVITDVIDYRFTRVNDRFCQMLGYPREELMELTLLDVTHPEDISYELKLLEDVLNNQIPIANYEKRYLTRQKKTFWARITQSAIFDNSNKPVLALGMIENIQERRDVQNQLETQKKEHDQNFYSKAAEIKKLNDRLIATNMEKKILEENLETFKTRFMAISQASADIVFFKDMDLRYTYVNSSMAKTFGVSEKDMIGKTAHDVFSLQSAEQIRQLDLRVLSGETVENESLHWINGSTMCFQEFRAPLKDSNGRITGLLGLVQNITDKKKNSNLIDNKAPDYPSNVMRATMQKAAFAADTDSIVLLEGESGSGKDHIARWIHEHSKRSSGPFLGINCAALPHELAESELFGHEQGAFTGAKGRKRGLLELAEGGTLLLNEIGELSLALQTKLLTFLDTRSFMRVGGEKSIKVNARLMAATHRDLKDEVAQGRFERALFYRLNVFSIRIPPLRERVEDLPILVREMINALAQEIQLQEIPEIDHETLSGLALYDWPGNVRELRNVIERGLMLSRGPALSLPAPLIEGSDLWTHKITFPDQQDLNQLIRDIKVNLCNEALRRSSGNRTRAASLLGISRDAFYRCLKAEQTMSGFKTDHDEE